MLDDSAHLHHGASGIEERTIVQVNQPARRIECVADGHAGKIPHLAKELRRPLGIAVSLGIVLRGTQPGRHQRRLVGDDRLERGQRGVDLSAHDHRLLEREGLLVRSRVAGWLNEALDHGAGSVTQFGAHVNGERSRERCKHHEADNHTKGSQQGRHDQGAEDKEGDHQSISACL
ncbi:MAG: hypothetical protein ABI625_19405 [bacterium]